MDAGRNYQNYIDVESKKVDRFLGRSDWRQQWITEAYKTAFPEFLATEFAHGMEKLGYQPTPLYHMKRVRSDEKNLPQAVGRSEKEFGGQGARWQNLRRISRTNSWAGT